MAERISVDISRVGDGDDDGRPEEPAPSEAPRARNTCPSCRSHYREEEMVANLRVCTHCGYHFPVTARERIVQLTDDGSWSEVARDLISIDPLEFVDSKPYPERLDAAERATGLHDAMLVGGATIGEMPVALAVMDFTFLGGSMGSVVGEKFWRAAELSLDRRMPLVSVSSSGGARMQEGVLALMQMAKTVAAVDELREAAVPYVSVMAHPTTGGVAASFAALGDVIDRRARRPALVLRAAGGQADDRRDAARTTSAWPSPTSATATSIWSCPGPSCATRSPASSRCCRAASRTGAPPLLPDLGAQRAVGRVISGARKAILGRRNEHVDD